MVRQHRVGAGYGSELGKEMRYYCYQIMTLIWIGSCLDHLSHVLQFVHPSLLPLRAKGIRRHPRVVRSVTASHSTSVVEILPLRPLAAVAPPLPVKLVMTRVDCIFECQTRVRSPLILSTSTDMNSV